MQGNLNGIEIGSPSNSIRELFGEPEDIGKGLGKIKIEKYFGGSLEVSLLKNKVVLICIYFKKGMLNNFKDHEELHVEFPEGVLKNQSSFEKWLTKNNISYSTRDAGNSFFALSINEGVTIGFEAKDLITIQSSY